MPASPPPVPRSSSDRSQETSLQELWSTVSRNRRTVLGITLAVVVLTGVISVLVSPVYESEAVVRIDAEDTKSKLFSALGPLGEMSGMGGLSSLAESEIDTEMGVLRSRRVATEVADSLGLVVRVIEPETRGPGSVRVVGEARDTVGGTFVLRRTGDGDYRLSASLLTFRHPPLPRRVREGEPFRIGGTTLVLRPAGGDPPGAIRFRLSSYQEMLRELDKRLKVETQASGSKLVEVKYRNTDPEVAAAVVNGIVDTYLAYRLGTDRSDSRRMIDTLREETARYALQLRQAEDRLQGFQQTNLVIAPEDQATAQIERAAEIQVNRDVLEVERDALAVLLEDVRRHAAAPGEPSPYRRLASFPTFVSNPGVQDVVRILNELENQRNALLSRRTEENVDVRTLDERISQLDLQLHRLGTNYLRGLENQIASSNAALARFEREIAAVPALEVEYTRLLRERELLSEIYVAMQARLEEAQVQDAIDEREVRVIDYGLVPEEPVFPKPLVNVVLATVLGLMIGLSLVMGREMVTTRIRTRSDAELAAAGVPVLAVIPPARPAPDRENGNGRGRLARFPWISSNGHHAPSRGLVTALDDMHPAAEAYRSLLTTLSYETGGEGVDVVSVTGPEADSAAPRVAANLAVTLARHGSRTLLIDAWPGSPAPLHRLFELDAGPGLAGVLAGAPVGDAVRAAALDGGAARLDVLTAGDPGAARRSLRRATLEPVISAARGEWDSIVVVAPPLDVSADATVIGKVADTTLLVARNGSTTQEALEAAATRLRRAEVAVGGLVLDDTPAAPRTPLATWPGSART